MFGPGTFIFGVVIPLSVVALAAAEIWELIRSRDTAPAMAGAAGPAASASARTILDERFARGEVDVDEYVRRRALLDGSVPSPPVDVVPATGAVVGEADTDVARAVDVDPDDGSETTGS